MLTLPRSAQRRRRLAIVVVLAAIGIVPLAVQAGRPVLAALPIARLDLPWWGQRFAAKQAELAARPPQLLLLGDSIMQELERTGPEPWQDFAPVWQKYYAPRNTANLGFIGDTTANLLWRETHGELDHIHPRAAIMLIGANNLGRLHWSAADTLAGIDADVQALRQRLPQTHLLLLGVLPSIRNPWATQTTAEINHALAARYGAGADRAVTYIDVSAALQTHGQTDPALFVDPHLQPPDPPLHPSPEGWQRISAMLAPTLGRLLAAP